LKLVLSIIQAITSVFLVIVILLQPSKTAGFSESIGGCSNTFFAKNKAKTFNARLTNATTLGAIVFFVVAIIMNLI